MQLRQTRFRQAWLAPVIVLALLVAVLAAMPVRSALAATKTLYIPSQWTQTGEVPWSQDRTKESTNFILMWGEKSGTSPTRRPRRTTSTRTASSRSWRTSTRST